MTDQNKADDDQHLQDLRNLIRSEARLNELEAILVTLSRLEPTDEELDAIVSAIKRNRVT